MGDFQTHISVVLCMGVKLFFFVFFSSCGHPQQKVLKGQEFSGMGCLKMHLRVKRKKAYSNRQQIGFFLCEI